MPNYKLLFSDIDFKIKKMENNVIIRKSITLNDFLKVNYSKHTIYIEKGEHVLFNKDTINHLKVLMEDNDIVLISQNPEKVLHKIPFPKKWELDISISKENKKYKWEKLVLGYNNLPKYYDISLLWICVNITLALGEFSKKYQGFYGGRNIDTLKKSINLTHPEIVMNDVQITSIYCLDIRYALQKVKTRPMLKNPLKMIPQKDTKKWVKNNPKSIKTILHKWGENTNIKHKRVYCGFQGELAKTKNPHGRPNMHQCEICYGQKNMPTLPIIINKKIKKKAKLIAWHNLTGDIFYALN